MVNVEGMNVEDAEGAVSLCERGVEGERGGYEYRGCGGYSGVEGVV